LKIENQKQGKEAEKDQGDDNMNTFMREDYHCGSTVL
jgi:hypothetical protein